MKWLFSLSLAVVFLAGCARKNSLAPVAELPPIRVRTALAQTESVAQLTEITGTVRPVQRAILTAKVTGAITELPVMIGQRVRAGDVLAKLSSAEAGARVAQSRAQLNMAQHDWERERDLLPKGASTADAVRVLQDKFTGAEAALREAEAQLSYTEIRAPFDAVIARRPANAGDLASPDKPLLEIEGYADFEIEAGIPESLAMKLVPGATLACEAGGVAFTGSLREISSAADEATRTVGVKIAVPAGAAVRSGQFARVQVPAGAIRALLVPLAAVSVDGQMERVFVVSDGHRAVLRIVKTGATRGDRVEIQSGLADQERVVVAPPVTLRDGQLLEAQP